MIRNAFWTTNTSNILSDEPLHQFEFEKVGKSKQNIELRCFKSGHILIIKKDKNNSQRYLYLTFNLKYEVYRQWKNQQQEMGFKGEIKSVRIVSDSSTKTLEISGMHQNLLLFCQFLSQYLNKIGFHQYFKIQKKLGQGNFATVFKAQRYEDGLWMAVKAYHKKTLYSEQLGKEALINEISIMRRLNHPNLMKLYEVYETDNSIYLCMELMKGRPLYDYYRKNYQFDQKSIFSIMEGLVSGVRYLHKNGIMHRDLKLENILFRESGNFNSVVIVDFGLSTFASDKPYLFPKCGTPGFIAPEIINNPYNSSQYEYSCDMFSLGIIFYILLTGEPAFQGRNFQELIKNNVKGEISFKHQRLKYLPQSQYMLLRQLLIANPVKRINSLDAFNHPYFNQEVDEIFAQMAIDDEPKIEEMISKINIKYIQQGQFCKNVKQENNLEQNIFQTDQLIEEQNECIDQLFSKFSILADSTRTILNSISKQRHHFNSQSDFISS